MNTNGVSTKKIGCALFGAFWVWLFFSNSLHLPHLNPDGILYFAYLRSIFFDADLLFVNEFDTLHLMPYSRYLTATGLEGNHVAVGTAILMSPFYGAAFLVDGAASLFGLDIGFQGYQGIYALVFPLGSLCYGIITLFLIHRVIGSYGDEDGRAATLLHISLGTPFIFYWSIHYQMSHLCSAFAVTLFVYLFETLRKKNRAAHGRDYFLLGLAGGLAVMVRTQNLLFGIIPILWMAAQAVKDREYGQPVSHLLSLTGGGFIGVIPQLVVWKTINGGWINTVESHNIDIASPHLVETIFSSYHGLFFWTPIVIFAILGLVLLAIRDLKTGLAYGMAFGGQLILNSSIFMWWEAASFGMRLFTNCTPVLAIGLAVLYQSINRIWIRLLGWGFVAFTLLLIVNVLCGVIDLNLYYRADEILKSQIALLQNWIQPDAFFCGPSGLVLHPYRAALLMVVAAAVLIFSRGVFRRLRQAGCIASGSKMGLGNAVLPGLVVCVSLALLFFGFNSQRHKADHQPELDAVAAVSDQYAHYMMWSYWFFNAQYLEKNGRENEAIAELEKVIQYRPDFLAAYQYLSHLLIKNRRFQEAFAIAESGLNVSPQDRFLNSQVEYLTRRLKKRNR